MGIVLVCDDSSVELEHLRNIIVEAGWEVVTVSRGEDAVRRAVEMSPDLIFLDIVMPGMDGYEACRLLRHNQVTSDIPVVFVSSKKQKADEIWAKMQGGRSLIGKPFTPDQIQDALREYG